MREEWRKYWTELRRYRRYPVWGFVTSLIPFAFSYPYWKSRDAVGLGLLLALNVSLWITIMIFALVGGGFAFLTWLRIRNGVEIKRATLLQYILVGLGVSSGIWIGLSINGEILGQRPTASTFLSALTLSLLVASGFALHFAYRTAREDALVLRTAVAEARYNALEHQMRPHFLFNSLNSLAELIESGQENAVQMTHGLADLYRMILANSKNRTSSLASELEIARNYLELERLRFGSRLQFSIATLPGESLYVPSLMIQTLVENAVKHGIAKSVAGGTVNVQVARLSADWLEASVENTGAAPAALAMTGTGLANTRARLDLLYGERHEFSIDTNEKGTVVARFLFTGARID